jgi:transcription termination factor NusB
MAFSKKQQTRVWLVSILYETFIKNATLYSFDKVQYDDFGKGDVEYLKKIYEVVLHKLPEIDIYLTKMTNLSTLSILLRCILTSCLAELSLGVEKGILMSSYLNIINLYNEKDPKHLLNTLINSFSENI